MQPLPNDKAVAHDYDDIVSSQDDTWSRQNHGAQATKPRKRGISNPTAPPSKVRQRKTNMEKCADYERETALMTVAAQQVLDSGTLEDAGPSAREKELEARAASLQKTAMAKMEGFLKLNSDWMSISSNFSGLNINDSEAQCSNDSKDLMTQVGLFSAAIGDRSSRIQHFKQKGDELEIEKERTRVLDLEIKKCKEKLAATKQVEQRLRNERNTLRIQVNTYSSESKQVRTASIQTSDIWDHKMVTLEQDLAALAVELERSKQINDNAGKTAKDRSERDKKTISELRKELASAGSLSKKTKEAYGWACTKIKTLEDRASEHATETKRLKESSTEQERQNDLLQSKSLFQEDRIESLERDDKRSASNIHKLESDLQQIKLDLVSSNSEIGALNGSLISKNAELTEAWYRLRDLERLYRQQERDLDSLRDLEPEREKATRLQDDLRHNVSNLQLTQSELERSRASASVLTEKIGVLRMEMRELKSALDEVQTDRDIILSDKMDLEKDRGSLLSRTATLEEERDGLLSEKALIKEERDSLHSERATLQEERGSLLSERATLQEERDKLVLEKSRLQKEKESLQYERNLLQREKDDLLSERGKMQEEKNHLRSERDQSKRDIQSLRSENANLQEARANLESDKIRLEKGKLDQLMESQRGRANLLVERDTALRQKEEVLSQKDQLQVRLADKVGDLEEQQRMTLSLQASLESSKSEFADSRQCTVALIRLIFDQIKKQRIISTRVRQLTSQVDSTNLENQHHLANISALEDQVQSEKAALVRLPRCNRFFYQKMWWLMLDFGEQGGFECLCLKDDLPKEVRKRLMGALEEKLPPEDVLVALES